MKSKVKIPATQLIAFYNEGYTISEMSDLINQELEQSYPEDQDYRVADNSIRDMFAVLNKATGNAYDLRKKPQRKLVELDLSELEAEAQLANQYDANKEELDPRYNEEFND